MLATRAKTGWRHLNHGETWFQFSIDTSLDARFAVGLWPDAMKAYNLYYVRNPFEQGVARSTYRQQVERCCIEVRLF